MLIIQVATVKLTSMNVHQIHASEVFALTRSIPTTAYVQLSTQELIATVILVMSAHRNHVSMVVSVLTR